MDSSITTGFSELPAFVKGKIIGYLSEEEVLKLRLVDKKTKNIIDNQKILDKKLNLNHFFCKEIKNNSTFLSKPLWFRFKEFFNCLPTGDSSNAEYYNNSLESKNFITILKYPVLFFKSLSAHLIIDPANKLTQSVISKFEDGFKNKCRQFTCKTLKEFVSNDNKLSELYTLFLRYKENSSVSIFEKGVASYYMIKLFKDRKNISDFKAYGYESTQVMDMMKKYYVNKTINNIFAKIINESPKNLEEFKVVLGKYL